MPSYILKPRPDVDLYVEWSTVVDGPTFTGTRAEMLNMLVYEAFAQARVDANERLDRADEKGTSAHFGGLFGGMMCNWTPDGQEELEGRYWLPREKLYEYLTSNDPMSVLEPLED
jgi:hypothetical protein